MRIDSHQHFWKYSETAYPWIPKGSPLHRDWLPRDLEPLLAAEGIGGCVAVQARQTLEESEWLLALAKDAPVIRGVIGWVDLRDGAVGDQLTRLCADRKFRGVRHVVQDERDPEFMLRPDFQHGIESLKRFDLTYDILIQSGQLPAAVRLAQKFPEQPFVLDHLAKPAIKRAELSPWRDDLRELAKCENVWCKVSGMVTEADHAAWKSADFRPYLDVVFQEFGVNRLMFGSDWPVCLLAGTYERVFALVQEYLSEFDESARSKVLGANAVKFYGLT